MDIVVKKPIIKIIDRTIKQEVIVPKLVIVVYENI